MKLTFLKINTNTCHQGRSESFYTQVRKKLKSGPINLLKPIKPLVNMQKNYLNLALFLAFIDGRIMTIIFIQTNNSYWITEQNHKTGAKEYARRIHQAVVKIPG